MVQLMAAHREKARTEVAEEMGDIQVVVLETGGTQIVAVACVPGVYLSQEDNQ
jgi:hypothetical protein